jgi:hypothetical protein
MAAQKKKKTKRTTRAKLTMPQAATTPGKSGVDVFDPDATAPFELGNRNLQKEFFELRELAVENQAKIEALKSQLAPLEAAAFARDVFKARVEKLEAWIRDALKHGMNYSTAAEVLK